MYHDHFVSQDRQQDDLGWIEHELYRRSPSLNWVSGLGPPSTGQLCPTMLAKIVGTTEIIVVAVIVVGNP